mmetsp:Transcript_136782/g.381276  ORF Transcript_136782/g.381276 Transcript_136782/m.381276 type:complete len:232 (-) Transcript_136782:2976-3671(-)
MPLPGTRGVSSVHTSLTMLSLRFIASTEALVNFISLSYFTAVSMTALSTLSRRSPSVPWCASRALASLKSCAWASLVAAISFACLSKLSPIRLSKVTTRSCTEAWLDSRLPRSFSMSSRTALCCLSRAALSFSKRPSNASTFLCASVSSCLWLSAESCTAASTKATRSSIVAKCVCDALRASSSLTYLPWAVSCLEWAALNACTSRRCSSAESPSTFSRYSRRSGTEAWWA